MADIPWTWLAIRGSGITAWALLTAVVVWGLLLRTRLLGKWAAPVALLDMHRWLGALALTFLGVHLGLLLVDQHHAALGQLVGGEEGVVGVADDVDDGVADAQHVESGGSHGVS